jgi:hypothetical protein
MDRSGGAIKNSRARLKPEIPTVGEHGIPLRDELELEPPVVAETGPRPVRGAADGRP